MAQDVILIVTNDRDEHAREVVRRLGEKGVATAQFDPAKFPSRATIAWGQDAYTIGGLDLSAVKSVWLRRCDYPTGEATLSGADRAFAATQGVSALWGVAEWLNGNAFMANSLPSAVANDGGHGKLNQLAMAKWRYMRTPRTLVTNDPILAQDFVSTLGAAVVKPFRSLQSRLVYAWEVKPGEDLNGCCHAPWIFQEKIAKAFDLRIAVFGRRVMATAIYSDSLDCRRDLSGARHAPHEIPEWLHSDVCCLTESLGLAMGIHDFVVTPDGDYVYLETNQQGQFLWMEHKTGQPYLESLCDFLIAADKQFR